MTGNRYGFALHHIRSAGGRIKGLLFFQGEQDAIFGDEEKSRSQAIGNRPGFDLWRHALRGSSKVSARMFATRPLPVIFAQICRHHNGPDGRARAWEMVREAQRRLPERLANTHCVPSIDTRRDGRTAPGLRLAEANGRADGRLALPYVKKGTPARAEIRLKSVTREALAARPARGWCNSAE